MASPSWDDVEVGDKVTFAPQVVTITTLDRKRGLATSDVGSPTWGLAMDNVLNPIQSVEKPVVTFKPGDVVRNKEDRGLFYLLGGEGRYFSFLCRDWLSPDGTEFTSKHYELIEP